MPSLTPLLRTSFARMAAACIVTLAVFTLAATAETGGPAHDGPTWTALLPPLLAIGLAIALREVIGSLLLGIVVGAILLRPDELGTALVTVPSTLLVDALADPGHASIVLFSLMLGGMVGVLAKSGGMAGIVRSLKSMTSTRRGGLLTTWLLGLIIFFDDYANTLLVGNTVRPFTDELKVSRAKLAYIVDSTSAPIASIAVISTWVGFEIGLIQDAAAGLAGVGDAYIIFLRSIPYSFYSILALGLVASVLLWNRDFGPMLRAERGALADRDETREDTGQTLESSTQGRFPVAQALVPVGLVIVTTFVGLYVSGLASTPADAPLFEILGGADSAEVLLVASFIGLISAAVLAATLGRIPVQDVSQSIIDGVKAMMPAMVILLLAWSLGGVCDQLGTARFVIDAVTGSLPPALLPATVFMVAAAIAFATGTSWGVMAILVPIAVPLAHTLPLEAGITGGHAASILYGTVGAVLAGATWGDHCSPISDTTILSSMATGCRHIDHVRTQIPYALLAGGLAIVVGYLPAGLGLPVWISLLVGIAAIVLLPRWVMRPTA